MSTSTLTISNLAEIRQFCAAAGAFGGLAPRFLGQSIHDSEITPERLMVMVREANDAAHVCRERGDQVAPVEIEMAGVTFSLRSTALVLTYGSGRTFARLEYAIGAGASGGDVAAFSVGVYQCDDVLKPGVDFATVLDSISARRMAALPFALPAEPAASDEDCTIERIPRAEIDAMGDVAPKLDPLSNQPLGSQKAAGPIIINNIGA